MLHPTIKNRHLSVNSHRYTISLLGRGVKVEEEWGICLEGVDVLWNPSGDHRRNCSSDDEAVNISPSPPLSVGEKRF